MKFINILLVSAILALTGCGGGGSSNATPPVAVKPVQTCTPRVVSVALIGDSTMYGIDGTTTTPDYFGAQAVHNPGTELQTVMDARFGPGAVVVTNYGVPGTSSVDAPSVTADIKVVNYGINDMVGGVPLDVFFDRMHVLTPTIVETPMPAPYGDSREAGYIGMDEALGVPVADVFTYVQSLPDWQSYFPHPTSVHGNDALYKLIVDNVLAPAVAKQVAPLRCQ